MFGLLLSSFSGELLMRKKLKQSVVNILKLNAKLVGQPAKRSGSPEFYILDTNIKSVVAVIEDAVPAVSMCDVTIGRGIGNLARVPWIYISKIFGPVSSKVGVAICFCKRGNGVVTGKMYPIGIVHNQERRSLRRDDANFIDVNGASYTTKYNDRFVDPFEMYKFDFQSELFISELKNRIKAL